MTYQDLDEIPDSESCNKCSCDFGEIICTEEVCNNQTEEYISNTDFDELIEYEYESIPDVATSSIPSSTSTQGNLLRSIDNKPVMGLQFSICLRMFSSQ